MHCEPRAVAVDRPHCGIVRVRAQNMIARPTELGYRGECGFARQPGHQGGVRSRGAPAPTWSGRHEHGGVRAHHGAEPERSAQVRVVATEPEISVYPSCCSPPIRSRWVLCPTTRAVPYFVRTSVGRVIYASLFLPSSPALFPSAVVMMEGCPTLAGRDVRRGLVHEFLPQTIARRFVGGESTRVVHGAVPTRAVGSRPRVSSTSRLPVPAVRASGFPPRRADGWRPRNTQSTSGRRPLVDD